MLVMPTAMATLTVPNPNAVTSASDSSNAGMASSTSTTRISDSSTQPRRKPASSPNNAPTTRPKDTATRAAPRDSPAPCTVRENRSRPSWVGPEQMLERRRLQLLSRRGPQRVDAGQQGRREGRQHHRHRPRDCQHQPGPPDNGPEPTADALPAGPPRVDALRPGYSRVGGGIPIDGCGRDLRHGPPTAAAGVRRAECTIRLSSIG